MNRICLNPHSELPAPIVLTHCGFFAVAGDDGVLLAQRVRGVTCVGIAAAVIRGLRVPQLPGSCLQTNLETVQRML